MYRWLLYRDVLDYKHGCAIVRQMFLARKFAYEYQINCFVGKIQKDLSHTKVVRILNETDEITCSAKSFIVKTLTNIDNLSLLYVDNCDLLTIDDVIEHRMHALFVPAYILHGFLKDDEQLSRMSDSLKEETLKLSINLTYDFINNCSAASRYVMRQYIKGKLSFEECMNMLGYDSYVKLKREDTGDFAGSVSDRVCESPSAKVLKKRVADNDAAKYCNIVTRMAFRARLYMYENGISSNYDLNLYALMHALNTEKDITYSEKLYIINCITQTCITVLIDYDKDELNTIVDVIKHRLDVFNRSMHAAKTLLKEDAQLSKLSTSLKDEILNAKSFLTEETITNCFDKASKQFKECLGDLRTMHEKLALMYKLENATASDGAIVKKCISSNPAVKKLVKSINDTTEVLTATRRFLDTLAEDQARWADRINRTSNDILIDDRVKELEEYCKRMKEAKANRRKENNLRCMIAENRKANAALVPDTQRKNIKRSNTSLLRLHLFGQLAATCVYIILHLIFCIFLYESHAHEGFSLLRMLLYAIPEDLFSWIYVGLTVLNLMDFHITNFMCRKWNRRIPIDKE